MSPSARRRTCLFAPVLFAMSFAPGCSDDGESTNTTISTVSITGDDTTGPDTGDDTAPGTGATTGDDPTTGGTGTDPDVTPYCVPVADAKWLGPWIERELEILDRVNQIRAQGYNCGSTGNFPPAGPLELEARLHCAARKHSQDMAERDFFDHTNPDGESPFDRMDNAGYAQFSAAGENIAAGSDDPETTVQGWLDSDQHCANMLDSKYKHFGIGFYEGPGMFTYYWTQVFATPL